MDEDNKKTTEDKNKSSGIQNLGNQIFDTVSSARSSFGRGVSESPAGDFARGVADSPIASGLRGVGEQLFGGRKDEEPISQTTNLRGLSSSDRVKRLRESIDKTPQVDATKEGFRDIGNLLSRDFVQAIPRAGGTGLAIASKQVEPAFEGAQEFTGLPFQDIYQATRRPEEEQIAPVSFARQLVFGTKEPLSQGFGEYSDREFGLSPVDFPTLAPFVGFVGLALEGLPWDLPIKKIGRKLKNFVGKETDPIKIDQELAKEIPELTTETRKNISEELANISDTNKIEKSIQSAKYFDNLETGSKAMTARGVEQQDAFKKTNNILTKGGDVDPQGYSTIYLKGSKKNIQSAKKTGDLSGVDVSITKPKRVKGDDELMISRSKVPAEDVRFRLGGKVGLEDGALGRAATPTESRMATSISRMSNIPEKDTLLTAARNIDTLKRAGSKSSTSKLATLNKVRNALKSFGDGKIRNFQGKYKQRIESATKPSEFSNIVDEMAQEYSPENVAKRVEDTKKMSKEFDNILENAPRGDIKKRIRELTGQRKLGDDSAEMKMLNNKVKYQSNIALADSSAEKLKRAKEAFDALNETTKRPTQFEEVNLLSKNEKEAVTDIYKGETYREYAVGKSEKVQREIYTPAAYAVDSLKRIVRNYDESANVYNYRETQDTSFLDGFPSSEKEKIIEANKNITKATQRITRKLKELDLLEDAADQETYLRAFLINSDGSAASAENIVRLRNASEENFSDLMSSFSQGITKSSIKENRKYLTADERDEALARFGLKTDRDIVRTVAKYAQQSGKLIEKHTITSTLRNIAREGTRDDLIELYDPKQLKSSREKIRDNTSGNIKLLKEDKKLTKEASGELAKAVSRAVKELDESYKGLRSLQKMEGDDFVGSVQSEKLEEIETYKRVYDQLLDDIKGLPKSQRSDIEKRINKLKADSEKRIRGIYEEISLNYGKAVDRGLVKLDSNLPASDIRTVEGVMGTRTDADFINEIFKKQENNTILDNLSYFSQVLKISQATFDLFSLPVSFWASTTAGNPVRSAALLFRKPSNRPVTETTVEEASEFMSVGRSAIGDVEIQKLDGEIEENFNFVQNTFSKLDDITDIEVGKIKTAKEKIGRLFTGLEKIQFEGVMTNMKVATWERKVQQLVSRGFDEREAKVEAGRVIDTLFGVTSFSKMLANNPKNFSKTVQAALRVAIFAPNLLASTVKMAKLQVRGAVGLATLGMFDKSVRGALARETTFKTLLYGVGGLQAASYAMNGHSTFENENPNMFLHLKMPFKDEQGNDMYLNPMGYLFRGVYLLNRPLQTMFNKTAGLPRFAHDLIVGDEYAEPTDSRFLTAASNVVPMPFTMQNVSRFAAAQYTDEPQYGVAENAQEMLMASVLEFNGMPSVYASQDPSSMSFSKWTKDVNSAMENNESLDYYFESSVLRSVLTSEVPPTKQDIYKAKYDISGRTTDEDFLRAVAKMPDDARADFLSGYAKSTRQRVNREYKRYPSGDQNGGSDDGVFGTGDDIPTLDMSNIEESSGGGESGSSIDSSAFSGSDDIPTLDMSNIE